MYIYNYYTISKLHGNWKPKIYKRYIQKKKQDYKLNINDTHPITGENNKKKKKEEGKKKDLQKQTPEMNKMAIGTYISIFSLNVNGLNAPPKRYTLVGWIQKQTHMCAVYKRPTSDLETHTDWKWGDGERYSMEREIKRKLK